MKIIKKFKYLFLSILILLIFITTLLILNNRKLIIKFDSNGGNFIEDCSVKKGDKVNKPQDPIKDGFVFIEWQHNGETFDFSLPVKTNLNLIAKWEEKKFNKEYVLVKFNSNGGTTLKNLLIEKNQKIEKPKDIFLQGYKFIEWQHNGETFDFNKEVNEDIELIAIWKKETNSSKPQPEIPNEESSNNEEKKEFNVFFDSQGGSIINEVTVLKGEKITEPKQPKKQGYEFIGWKLNDKLYDFNLPIDKNLYLTAEWKAIPHKFMIMYHVVGGTNGPINQTKEVDTDIKLSTEIPIRENYDFVEWNTSSSGGGISYNPGDVYKGNYNLDLYSIWKPSPIIEQLKIGDYVKYTANGYSDWRVLYNDSINGLQIISENVPEKLEFGSKKYESWARGAYLDYIENLNNASQKYINRQFATKARSVGSNPTNPNLYSIITSDLLRYKIDSSEMNMVNDEFYTKDLKQMKKIETNKEKDLLHIGEEYYFASRGAYEPYGDDFDTHYALIMYNIYAKNISTKYIIDVNSRGEIYSLYTIKSGLRPCVTLKNDLKIIDGNGTKNNPYQFEN